ncbi:recombinase family protein [Streptomyces sp. NPDC047000]|uniref:recombinase family protein n=1 Tax=Streptomyces sp. NPDC047000 TaxID=3155474 RepID=UPI003400753E
MRYLTRPAGRGPTRGPSRAADDRLPGRRAAEPRLPARTPLHPGPVERPHGRALRPAGRDPGQDAGRCSRVGHRTLRPRRRHHGPPGVGQDQTDGVGRLLAAPAEERQRRTRRACPPGIRPCSHRPAFPRLARRSWVTRIFSEKISTRATQRPELDKAVALAGELCASGMRVTLVVHEHKRLGRGIELATLAEELKASDVGLEFFTGELQGSHDPSGVVFTVLAALSGMEREYIRDRTLEGHESARKRGKTIGGAGVTDDDMLSMALHLREQEMSLRDIAKRLVITTGKKKGQHPLPATVMRMLREHDEQTTAAAT